jgi:hypothetical protein
MDSRVDLMLESRLELSGWPHVRDPMKMMRDNRFR